MRFAEYSPLEVKKSVVGYGRAEKTQVQQMVASLLRLAAPVASEDASDALAIAICHATHASCRWFALQRWRLAREGSPCLVAGLRSYCHALLQRRRTAAGVYQEFPGSVPAYIEISVEKNGSVVYKEAPDDNNPITIQMPPADCRSDVRAGR